MSLPLLTKSDFSPEGPLKLGALIRVLEALELDCLHEEPSIDLSAYAVVFDFGDFAPAGLACYRRCYRDLAISYEDSYDGYRCSADEFLRLLKDTDGKVFAGFKGGESTMDKETSLWVARLNRSSQTGVSGVSLDKMKIVLETRYFP